MHRQDFAACALKARREIGGEVTGGVRGYHHLALAQESRRPLGIDEIDDHQRTGHRSQRFDQRAVVIHAAGPDEPTHFGPLRQGQIEREHRAAHRHSHLRRRSGTGSNTAKPVYSAHRIPHRRQAPRQ